MEVAQISPMATQDVEDVDIRLEYFGFVRGQIVGIQYYSGLVSNREMVALVREPQNQYDRNAVRVNNIMGEQVGHIKREMALALAKVVDVGLACIEGSVPSGSNQTYKIPVDISFWGDPSNKESTIRTMTMYGYTIIKNDPREMKQQRGSGRSGGPYTPARSRATLITSEQMKSELDTLFESFKEVDQNAKEPGCPAIKSQLYLHQMQALAWMRKKEQGSDLPPFWEERKPTAKIAAKIKGQKVYYNQVTNYTTTAEPKRVKGGILADDMGLGKTLVTIALILGNSWDGKPMHLLQDNKVKKKKIKKEIKIEEVIDLTQDDEEDEIQIMETEVKCEPAENIVEVPRKTTEMQDTAGNRKSKRSRKRNVQYTEPPDTEEDLANNNTRKSRKKSKKKKKKKTHTEEDYIPTEEAASSDAPAFSAVKSRPIHDGETLEFSKASPPPSQPSSTLIVCPLSLISNWEGQVSEHVHANANVNIFVYHGQAKLQVDKKKISKFDLVITTYQTLANEFKHSETSHSLLLNTKWLRVVLDEGHIVRNPRAQQSKACYSLKAQRKWVLTGTPIQNSVKDLWSIISFLGIEPFTNAQWWKRTIERPINDGDTNALKRIRCLLGAVCMRRTKQQKIKGKPIIAMPKKVVLLQKIDLSTKERELYDKMDKAGKMTIQRYINEGLVSTQYADVLVLLMRLRQICCHADLAKEAIEALMKGQTGSSKVMKELATKLMCMLESGSVDECCVCMDSFTMPVITRCAHVFCKLCICGVIANQQRNPTCPLCRGSITESELVEVPSDNNEMQEVSTAESSKVNALMHELLTLNREQPEVKSLVVSQFNEYLKIIEGHLVANNIPCVLYRGGMTLKKRDYAIEQLQHGHAKVMLLALKAGGVGLNLTAASQVFLMEPAWNPATEDQCFDRVHRLGQTKPVRIVKFVCNNTVEEKMLQMQGKKREIAKATLQRRSAEERKMQTVNDLRQLMEI